MRFRDRATGENGVKIIPAKNLAAMSDERIAAIRKLGKRGEKALRRAHALEQKVIRMKQAGAAEEPGPRTANIVWGRLVPRLHVRKRAGEKPPSEQ